MGHLGDQITNSIYKMNPGNNPFTIHIGSIDNGPDIVFVMTAYQLKVSPKGLKPMTAPYVVACLRMAIRFKKIIKHVFMQDTGLAHLILRFGLRIMEFIEPTMLVKKPVDEYNPNHRLRETRPKYKRIKPTKILNRPTK